jgi:hypothetical protein
VEPAVARAGDDSPAVPAKRDRVDRRIVKQRRFDTFSRQYIPAHRAPVFAAGDQRAAVGAKRQGVKANLAAVPEWFADRLALGHVPPPGSTVIATGHQSLAVGAESDAPNDVPGCVDQRKALPAAPIHIPETGAPFFINGDRRAAVARAKGNAADPMLAREVVEHERRGRFFSAGRVPGPDVVILAHRD